MYAWRRILSMEKCGGFAVRTGVGGVARGARFCSGREAATHVAAKAACVHVRLACAFVLLRCPKAPLRETWLPLLAPPPCRMTMRRGGVISALDAREPRSARQRARPLRGRHSAGLHGSLRASGGQGYFDTTLQRCMHLPHGGSGATLGSVCFAVKMFPFRSIR